MAFRSRRLRVQLPCQAESSLVDVVAARDAGECPAGMVSFSACNWVMASTGPCHLLTCLDLPACAAPSYDPPPPPPTLCPAGFISPDVRCGHGLATCHGGTSLPGTGPTDRTDCRYLSEQCPFWSHDVYKKEYVEDEGTILVAPEALSVLREALLEQVRQIEVAEQEKEHLQARIAEIDGAAEELLRRADADE